MSDTSRFLFAVLALAGVALAATPADAKQCFRKAAIGEAGSVESASSKSMKRSCRPPTGVPGPLG